MNSSRGQRSSFSEHLIEKSCFGVLEAVTATDRTTASLFYALQVDVDQIMTFVHTRSGIGAYGSSVRDID